jgi:RNA recognition motif-containing protein
MGARIYIENLPLGVTEEALRGLFAQDGRLVVSVTIMTDRRTGQSHGYAFVEMGSHADAAHAIVTLNGCDLAGHTLRVTEARPRMGNRVSS